MVNFSELAPEALTVGSSTGVDAPARDPELSPHVPARSDAESKPTHLSTPGCAHLVAKSAVPAGGTGEEGADAAEPSPELPPPPQAVSARVKSAASERFFIVVVRRALVHGGPHTRLRPCNQVYWCL